MTQKRIEYIDLAKGLCILLVIFHHIIRKYPDHPFETYRLYTVLSSFRMPLYFVLSGLFFKKYNGLIDFGIHKINKLLIPFLFFYLTISIVLAYIYKENGIHLDFEYDPFAFWNRGLYLNATIWFLLCLFEVNILFYLIVIISGKFKYDTSTVIVLSLIFGLGGYILFFKNISLPMYWDTSMTAIPFFCFGYMVNTKTIFLTKDERFHTLLVKIIIIFFCLYMFAGEISMKNNSYINTNVWQLYLCGIFGTLFVLYLSKLLKRLPVISYLGKYSIVILCTHKMLLSPVFYVCKKMLKWGGVWTESILILLSITLLMRFIVVPLCVKYCPYIFAQKDLIKNPY